MKIKQIGKNPDQDQSNTATSEKSTLSKRKILFIAGGIILFVIAAIIIYTFILNSKLENNRSYSDSLKLKELQLKERELKLKENNINTSERENINEILKNTVQSLISDFNAKSKGVGKYYSEAVSYYAWGPTAKDRVVKDKIAFYNRWDYLNMNISDLSVSQINENSYKCEYDKTLESNNYSNGKNLQLKVRSILVFTKINNEWLITEERDEKTHYLNKNY
jgi:hypothetical protein